MKSSKMFQQNVCYFCKISLKRKIRAFALLCWGTWDYESHAQWSCLRYLWSLPKRGQQFTDCHKDFFIISLFVNNSRDAFVFAAQTNDFEFAFSLTVQFKLTFWQADFFVWMQDNRRPNLEAGLLTETFLWRMLFALVPLLFIGPRCYTLSISS